jgi:hypothetical protein
VTVGTHPGASLETLSRHHDGELSAAERAAFEAHLAGCAECRSAAEAFERSLAAFRAAPDVPVPTDLSARILRKIRAQSPSRRPFGVMFGIDIRWAGVFLAAVLVAIIAPALLSSRRELTRPAVAPAPTPDALTAYVVDDVQADKDQAKKGESPANERGVPAERQKVVARSMPEPKTRERAQEAAAPAVGGALDQPVSGAPAPPLAAAAPEAAAAKPQATAGARNAVPRRSVASAAAESGGEVGTARDEARSAAVRIDVRAADSDGPAPEVERTPSSERLLPLRGREYLLVVEADGAVRGVEPSGRQAETKELLKEKDAFAAQSRPDNKLEAASAEDVLRELRFRATGRARRVLVRVQ